MRGTIISNCGNFEKPVLVIQIISKNLISQEKLETLKKQFPKKLRQRTFFQTADDFKKINANMSQICKNRKKNPFFCRVPKTHEKYLRERFGLFYDVIKRLF